MQVIGPNMGYLNYSLLCCETILYTNTETVKEHIKIVKVNKNKDPNYI